MQNKLLITGATGLLGANFVHTALAAGWAPVGVALPCRLPQAPVPMHELDLRDAAATATFLEAERPGLIVHLAALTNVDWCEEHAEAAFAINAGVSGQLAALAAQRGIRFVYMSTDSVFDGERGGYTEADAPHPLNVYAASKLAGEQQVLQAHPAALVVRSNIFGWNAQAKAGLAEWILAQLRAGQIVPGFTDVVFAPLLVTTLAELMLELAATGASGIWHLASAAAVSKFEFACALARAFELPVERVQAVSSSSVAQRARRPRSTWLDAAAAASRLGRPLPTLAGLLQEFRAQETGGYAQRLRASMGAQP
jgi:dTDP-4-dehydrorhamnose reductase